MSSEKYRLAAEAGDASAQVNLGFCYYIGDGVPKDHVEAVKWYRKAADQDDTSGQFVLGIAYEKGEGVPENLQEAVKWYLKAAEQGHVRAMCAVKAYIPEWTVKVVKWLRNAAEQGQPDAQLDLGTRYRYGDGVPKDYVEAYAWFNLAAASGDTVSIKFGALFRDAIEAEMLPEQVAEGQKRSRELAAMIESSI